MMKMAIRLHMDMTMSTLIHTSTGMTMTTIMAAHPITCGSCNDCGDKTAALLDYMLKHNEHHAAELDQVADRLRAEGKEAAADQIKKAVDEFKKGNLYLGLALATVKEQ